MEDNENDLQTEDTPVAITPTAKPLTPRQRLDRLFMMVTLNPKRIMPKRPGRHAVARGLRAEARRKKRNR